MDALIPWLVMGVPLLVAAGLLAWFLGKPAWEARRLAARAAGGDAVAQAAMNRVKKAETVMKRLLGGRDPQRERVLATGTPARAVIVSMEPIGLEVSAGPVPAQLIEVVLAIQTESSSRQVTVVDAVSEPLLGRLLEGATVPVRLDPGDPESAVVLWDTL